MTREEAIEVIEQDIPCEHDRDLIEALGMAISALSESNGGWYPLSYRPITEDELKDYKGWIDYSHPEETMILDCHLPDSGAEVLITANGYVGIDTFYNEDGECYFDSANIDEVTAWIPLPEPYKAEGEVKPNEVINHNPVL